MSLEQLEVLMALERWPLLAEYARQQLASDPEDALAHLYLIAALHNQGLHQQAWQHGESQRTLLASYPLFWRVRAQIALALGYAIHAQEALDRACALDVQAAENHRLRALLLWRTDDLKPIKNEIDAGLRLDPHSPGLLLLLARFFIRLRRPDRAEAVLAQRLAADPNDAEAVALKASLTSCPAERRSLYGWLLQHNPQDQAARAGWWRSNPRWYHGWWRSAVLVALVGSINSVWLQWQWQGLGLLLVVLLWLLTLVALPLFGRSHAQLTQILVLPLLLVDPGSSTELSIQWLGAMAAGSLLALMAELCQRLFWPMLSRLPWLRRCLALPT